MVFFYLRYIAIISLLSSIIFSSTREPRAKANDAARIATLKSFELALELYYTAHGKYPPITSSDSDIAPLDTILANFMACFGKFVTEVLDNGIQCSSFDFDQDGGRIDFFDLAIFRGSALPTYCYAYFQVATNGACSASPPISYDNSASGNLDSPGFIQTLADEQYINVGDWNDPLKPTLNSKMAYNCRYIVNAVENSANNVQKYALHCRMESQNFAASHDLGMNSILYEIQKPNFWLCVADNLVDDFICQ